MRTAVTLKIEDILLQTEDRTELDELFATLEQEIQVRGVLERICLKDIVSTTWEMTRLNRAKTELIRATFPRAVENLIRKLSPRGRPTETRIAEAPEGPREELALDWNSDTQARQKVLGFLKKFDLSEGAIEAEAVTLSMPMLEKIEQMLDSLDRRRCRAILNLSLYRDCVDNASPAMKRGALPNGAHSRRTQRLPRLARVV